MLSPETETNYTLISSQFGWRLTRSRLPDGSFNIEWRCPACWKEHKRLKQAADEARDPHRSSSMPPLGRSDAPLGTRPLPSFPSRPPPGSDEPPTLQRPNLERPRTPVMPIRPRGPASGPAPSSGGGAGPSPIPGRLPPPRDPRR